MQVLTAIFLFAHDEGPGRYDTYLVNVPVYILVKNLEEINSSY